jgi:hypothetical protein
MSVPPLPESAPTGDSEIRPTLAARFIKELAAARDALDPSTPAQILISGAVLAAFGYLGVHFVRGLYEADSVNKAIYPLFIVGTQVVNLLDLGWMSKKSRAKLELRRAESARWRETIAAHNARVLALTPPPGPAAPKE